MGRRPPVSDKVLTADDVACEHPNTKRCTRGVGLRGIKVRYECDRVAPKRGGNRARTELRTHTDRNTNECDESVPFMDTPVEPVVMPSLAMSKVRLTEITELSR